MDKPTKYNCTRRVVTAKLCLNRFLGSTVLVLLFSLCGLWGLSPYSTQFIASHYIGRLECDFFIVILLGEIGIFGYNANKEWKKYSDVRAGGIIYESARTLKPHELALALIVLVVLWAYFSISLMRQIPVGPWRLVIIASNIALVALTLREWYRLLFCRSKAIVAAESQEGVWPPPPIRPDDMPT